MIEIKIKGVQELSEKLKAFPMKVQKQVVRKANRDAANVFKSEAKNLVYQRVRKRTGALKEAIDVSKGTHHKGEYFTVDIVGFKKGGITKVAGKYLTKFSKRKQYLQKMPPYVYGRFLEKGTKHIVGRFFMYAAYKRHAKALKVYVDSFKNNFNRLAI